MREIKFRFFRTKVKEMVYGFEGCSLTYVLDMWEHERNVSEPMQYTGIRSNGFEIYEGDIILYDRNVHPSIDNLRYVVEWFENGYILKGKHNSFDAFDPGLLEVIGNIYENPELLEGDNQ